jgi:hypothetical protein
VACRAARNDLSGGPAYSCCLNNALVEAFATHLRNILEFMFPTRARPTDVMAADFCSSGGWQRSMSATCDAARIRAHKEIDHGPTSRPLRTRRGAARTSTRFFARLGRLSSRRRIHDEQRVALRGGHRGDTSGVEGQRVVEHAIGEDRAPVRHV